MTSKRLNSQEEKFKGKIPTLEIQGVSKSFRPDVFKKSYIAVDGLSLTFHEGECTGLLGHNGAGKTTTIRMILGLIQPQRGSIFFEGHPLQTEDKRFIGYMPEVNKLPLGLTVEEILNQSLNIYAFPKRMGSHEKRKIVEEKLQSLDLTPHRAKKVRQLSKGLARRLAFGQATIHQPRLLILDEPSTGLDPNAAEVLIEQIESEKQKGTTIILCTHELAHISSLCDHFFLMRQGRLVAQSISLNTVEGVESIDWGNRYNLQIADITMAQVEEWKRSQSLPSWRCARVEEKSVTLSFSSYDDSVPWLSTFLNQRHPILQFSEGHNLTATQIRKFFRGPT